MKNQEASVHYFHTITKDARKDGQYVKELSHLYDGKRSDFDEGDVLPLGEEIKSSRIMSCDQVQTG